MKKKIFESIPYFFGFRRRILINFENLKPFLPEVDLDLLNYRENHGQKRHIEKSATTG